MKRIIWIGESRVLPGHGMAVYGQHLLMSKDMADSYVAQGLAEPEKTPPTAKKSTTQEGES